MREADVTAIAEVVASVERAQRTESVDDFINLFREDAIWTTGHGKLLVGRAAIAEFTAQVLPGAMKDLVPSYEVVHMMLIAPDVVAVKVRQTYRTASGKPGEGEGTPMYVMAKNDGRWQLVACQNTAVLV